MNIWGNEERRDELVGSQVEFLYLDPAVEVKQVFTLERNYHHGDMTHQYL